MLDLATVGWLRPKHGWLDQVWACRDHDKPSRSALSGQTTVKRANAIGNDHLMPSPPPVPMGAAVAPSAVLQPVAADRAGTCRGSDFRRKRLGCGGALNGSGPYAHCVRAPQVLSCRGTRRGRTPPHGPATGGGCDRGFAQRHCEWALDHRDAFTDNRRGVETTFWGQLRAAAGSVWPTCNRWRPLRPSTTWRRCCPKRAQATAPSRFSAAGAAPPRPGGRFGVVGRLLGRAAGGLMLGGPRAAGPLASAGGAPGVRQWFPAPPMLGVAAAACARPRASAGVGNAALRNALTVWSWGSPDISQGWGYGAAAL